LAVWVDEPAYNFFPTALAAGAAVLAVLTLTSPIAIYCALLLGLLVPVGSFTFQVHRNRSAEAAYRHYSFVALGGCLGLAALALVLVSGAGATQQLLAAGAIERRAGTGQPTAMAAPLAALAFVAGGFAMIGAPPLVSFPGHFFVELIAFSYSGTLGILLVLA